MSGTINLSLPYNKTSTGTHESGWYTQYYVKSYEVTDVSGCTVSARAYAEVEHYFKIDYTVKPTEASASFTVDVVLGGNLWDYTESLQFNIQSYCVVSYDANGGTGSKSSVQVAAGGTYTIPSEGGFTREGYYQSGWIINGSTYSPGVDYTVDEDTTIYARWVFKSYSVDKSGTNCTVSASSTWYFDSALSISLTPGSTPGYTYSNPKIVIRANSSSGAILKTVNSSSTTFTMSGTYYSAIYIQGSYDKSPVQYTISASCTPAAGGTITTLHTASPGEDVTAILTLAEGYTVSSVTVNGVPYTTAPLTWVKMTNIQEDQTVVWTLSNVYQVKFIRYDGTYYTRDVDPGDSIDFVPQDTTGPGGRSYTSEWIQDDAYLRHRTYESRAFAGYYRQPDGQGGKITEATVPTSSMTVYAYWPYTPGTEYEYSYVVRYDLGEGTGTFPDYERTWSDDHVPILIPSEEPVKEGWTFIGWTSIPGSTDPEVLPGEYITAQYGLTILYAIYSTTAKVITFEGQGGTVPYRYRTTDNYGRLTSLQTPTWLYHSFIGWFTAPTGGTAISTATVFSEDTTVYAHWQAGATATLLANGGSFPNGSASYEILDPSSYVLPDWSVVDRLGYRLTGWVGSVSGSKAMGSIQHTSETWTAQWTPDVRGYSTEYRPKASVRIYRDLDEYIDLTTRMTEAGQPVIRLAENRPGMATFVINNPYNVPTESIVSESCELWSSGDPGAISTGMYVRIDDIDERGRPTYLMDGFITTISPDASEVRVEVGDRISFLGKAGASLRRNYYGTTRQEAHLDASSQGTLHADLSPLGMGATIDGSPYWSIADTMTATGSGNTNLLSRSGGASTEISLTDFRLFSLTVPTPSVNSIRGASFDIRGTFGVGGQGAVSGYIKATSGGASVSADWSEATAGGADVHIYPSATFAEPLEIGDTVTIELWVTSTVYGWIQSGYRTLAFRTPMSDDATYSLISEATTGAKRITATFDTYSWAEVTAYTVSGAELRPTAITGVADLTDPTLSDPSRSRCRLAYVSGGDTVPTPSIADNIALSVGMYPMFDTSALAPSETSVAIFRTGGGYAQDYLQKLADIASSDGRSRAYRVRGYTTPVLVYATRYKAGDTPKLTIKYGGQTVSDRGEVIDFASFRPTVTMKNRANAVMIRGTTQSNEPVMVLMIDRESQDRRYGIRIEEVKADSNVQSVTGAADVAYGGLSSNALDELEGTVTVAGCRTDIICPSGPYTGSGIPIRVYDRRNGIDGEDVKASEVTVDYNACTTQIQLTNHSILYSSALADTAVMAIMAGDMASNGSSTLYRTQYVALETDADLRDVSEVIAVVDGEDVPMVLDRIISDGTGYGLLVAHADDTTPSAQASSHYAVSAIMVDGEPYVIPESIRPDKYEGQYLIVNLYGYL